MSNLVNFLRFVYGAAFLGGVFGILNLYFKWDYVLVIGRTLELSLPSTYLLNGLLLGGAVVLFLVDQLVIKKREEA